jgi:hypothetical protein
MFVVRSITNLPSRLQHFVLPDVEGYGSAAIRDSITGSPLTPGLDYLSFESMWELAPKFLIVPRQAARYRSPLRRSGVWNLARALGAMRRRRTEAENLWEC